MVLAQRRGKEKSQCRSERGCTTNLRRVSRENEAVLERITARPKARPERKARVALARRLAVIMFAMVKHGAEFDPA
jgi:hypothetical protein